MAELLEKPIKVTEYHRAACQCRCCGDTYYAPLPDGVIEKQLFGPKLQCLVGYMKGTLGVSYSELQQFCSDVVGLKVSTKTRQEKYPGYNTITIKHQALVNQSRKAIFAENLSTSFYVVY